jgi:hypothetical protein
VPPWSKTKEKNRQSSSITSFLLALLVTHFLFSLFSLLLFRPASLGSVLVDRPVESIHSAILVEEGIFANDVPDGLLLFCLGVETEPHRPRDVKSGDSTDVGVVLSGDSPNSRSWSGSRGGGVGFSRSHQRRHGCRGGSLVYRAVLLRGSTLVEIGSAVMHKCIRASRGATRGRSGGRGGHPVPQNPRHQLQEQAAAGAWQLGGSSCGREPSLGL